MTSIFIILNTAHKIFHSIYSVNIEVFEYYAVGRHGIQNEIYLYISSGIIQVSSGFGCQDFKISSILNFSAQ